MTKTEDGGQTDRQSPRQSGASELAPAASPAQPPARLLSKRDFFAALGVGERKGETLIADGTIPPPLMLGERISRWTADDLAATIARLPRRQRAPEPPTLAEGRRAKIARLKAGGAA